jgi:transcriptional regulator with XRE-family HTH domain
MRLRNNIFAAAFDYLKRNTDIKTQKELAHRMGVTENTITRILKDYTEVTEDIITKLQTASGCIFNLQWLRGEDPNCMLMEDLAYYQQHPEERLVFERSQQHSSDMPHEQFIDVSSVFNSALAAKDETISALKSRIADLQRTIADKEEIIKAHESRIAELERQLAAAATSDLSRYPFTIGAAEYQDKSKI